VAAEVLGIMELANKGTWFDGEYQAATEDKNKAYRKMRIWYQKLIRRVQGKEKKSNNNS
jgi:hypothetical protein